MWYKVQWSYSSGLTLAHGGTWGEGKMVDLTDAQAAAVLADSPGVLVAVPGYVLPDPGAPDVDPEPFDAAPADRMLRKPGRKRAV